MNLLGEHYKKYIKKLLFTEDKVAVLVIAATVIYSAWPVFKSPPYRFPVATDAMGHLTKIKYLAECFREWKWPSWFPYWYCGSTTVQYYITRRFHLSF